MALTKKRVRRFPEAARRFQSPVRSSAFRRLGPIDLLKEELRTAGPEIQEVRLRANRPPEGGATNGISGPSVDFDILPLRRG